MVAVCAQLALVATPSDRCSFQWHLTTIIQADLVLTLPPSLLLIVQKPDWNQKALDKLIFVIVYSDVYTDHMDQQNENRTAF